MGPWATQLVFVKWSETEALSTPRTKLVAEAELC